LLSNARKLKKISLRKCELENEGLLTTFEVLSSLRDVTTIDYSHNGIFNKGIENICPFIGGCYGKSRLKSLYFDNNEIGDVGLKKLLGALDSQSNKVCKLSFVDNNLTDASASFLWHWLKRQRMRDVDYSMNLVVCDLSLNKIMLKNMKEVESQLNINRRFKLEAKNRSIQLEVKMKSGSKKKLIKCAKEKHRLVEELKAVEEDNQFHQLKANEFA